MSIGLMATLDIIARDAGLRSSNRAGSSRPAFDAIENLLRMLDALRRAAEFADLSGVPGIARLAAGIESSRGGVGCESVAGAGMHSPRVLAIRAQKLLLSGSTEGISNFAVRPTGRRAWRAGDSRQRRIETHRHHATASGRGCRKVRSRWI